MVFSSALYPNDPIAEGVAGTFPVFLRNNCVVIAVVEEDGMLRLPPHGHIVALQSKVQVLHYSAVGGQGNACRAGVGVFVGFV